MLVHQYVLYIHGSTVTNRNGHSTRHQLRGLAKRVCTMMRRAKPRNDPGVFRNVICEPLMNASIVGHAEVHGKEQNQNAYEIYVNASMVVIQKGLVVQSLHKMT